MASEDEGTAAAEGAKVEGGPRAGIAAAGSARAATSPPASGAGVSVAAGGLCLRVGRECAADTDVGGRAAENCHGE